MEEQNSVHLNNQIMFIEAFRDFCNYFQNKITGINSKTFSNGYCGQNSSHKHHLQLLNNKISQTLKFENFFSYSFDLFNTLTEEEEILNTFHLKK